MVICSKCPNYLTNKPNTVIQFRVCHKINFVFIDSIALAHQIKCSFLLLAEQHRNNKDWTPSTSILV